jgi:nucleoid DNA-binding protein
MKKETDKIIKHLSLKYHTRVVDIEDVVKSQFKFVKDTIESATKDEVETFKTIKLLSFGKFLVNDKVIFHMIKNKKKKDGDNTK